MGQAGASAPPQAGEHRKFNIQISDEFVCLPWQIIDETWNVLAGDPEFRIWYSPTIQDHATIRGPFRLLPRDDSDLSWLIDEAGRSLPLPNDTLKRMVFWRRWLDVIKNCQN